MLLRILGLTAATLITTGTTAAAGETADVAEIFAAECAQCHGRTARGMASFPSLRNKSAELLAERLESYRAKEAVGPNSMLMFPVVEDMEDAEIERLATFIAENFN